MIEFENVSFSYTGSGTWWAARHQFENFRTENASCSVAAAGAEKSTITRLVNGLIPQFYQGELQGRVLVDGQEISNIPMYQIAAKVGSVFQKSTDAVFQC